MARQARTPRAGAIARRAWLAAAAGAVLARPGVAQAEFPTRAVRLVVPFAPGGAIDLAGRAMAQALQAALGQPFVVDNRPGAGGLVGLNAVIRAAPDGYTLGVGSGGPLTIAPTLFPRENLDPLTQLTPVILTSTTSLVLLSRKGLSVSTLPELVSMSRRQENGLTMAAASAGGSLPQLAAEYLMARLGVRWLSIPHRGSPAALAELLGERVDVMLDPVTSSSALVLNNSLRPFAVTTAVRSILLPQVPTMQELGYADFDVGSWAGLVAPAGTPPEIIALLNRTLNEAMRGPELRQKLETTGAQVEGGEPARVTRLIAAELPRWAKIIQDAGITASSL